VGGSQLMWCNDQIQFLLSRVAYVKGVSCHETTGFPRNRTIILHAWIGQRGKESDQPVDCPSRHGRKERLRRGSSERARRHRQCRTYCPRWPHSNNERGGEAKSHGGLMILSEIRRSAMSVEGAGVFNPFGRSPTLLRDATSRKLSLLSFFFHWEFCAVIAYRWSVTPRGWKRDLWYCNERVGTCWPAVRRVVVYPDVQERQDRRRAV
jgi:hypothetical protein